MMIRVWRSKSFHHYYYYDDYDDDYYYYYYYYYFSPVSATLHKDAARSRA